MRKYKYFKLKEVQDWAGEYWDAYEERKSLSGLMIYKGWPYSLTPKDGIGGQFSVILTPEIADFLQVHPISVAEKQLGLSNSLVAKFRRTLGIQNKFIYRNNQWLLEHKDELLHDSLATLKAKYGLNRNQVYQHRKWLAELIEVPLRKKLRKSKLEDFQEEWFLKSKSKMINLSAPEIAVTYNISLFLAKKLYNRIRQEHGELGFSEELQHNKQSKSQWLLDHQDALLNSEKTVAELAEQFDKTTGQILRAKAKLRQILKIPKVKEQNHAWLLKYKDTLFNPNLSNDEIAQILNMNKLQVIRKKGQLKKLLGLPNHNDQIQAWRLRNQEILLSLHLPISEIARILDRKEDYIIKNRLILRKFLNISLKDQKRDWVLKHQNDLEQLSVNEFQEKYKLTYSKVQSYKKLLNELKQKHEIT
ncbi:MULTISPECIES: hypothetical protein [Acinetobacter calcoaceticus/baumannii complex]|uniref:hypothetical protein n=1 Tax=Acinetobacter calcoaceticus/baumannii complex TaxID=909768 RepID=UPI001A9B85AE|nr:MULTISPECIES: hypothetical protein [Acinetobacter calcoaceticus/baumannii complex]MBO1281715.1 hypothetical protein [Acinetobacter nosocomialis]QWN42804.1 hypothetical protein MFABIIPG_00228 [Acinetobacter baumannii]